MMKYSRGYLTVILIVLLCFCAAQVIAKQNDDQVTDEVEQLIEFVRISNCTFYRNGSWFEAGKAADHIYRKYQYVQKRGLIKTAEDFIKYAATKSSLSGKPYLVQCDGESLMCAEWLQAELVQIRKKK
jgi:Family of unknown function (DUF5329)